MTHLVHISELPEETCAELVKSREITHGPHSPEYASAWRYFGQAYDHCVRYNLRQDLDSHVMRDNWGECSRPVNAPDSPMTYADAQDELAWRVWCIAVRFRNLNER